MTDSIEFELAKTEMLKKYMVYLDTVTNITYKDSKKLDTKIKLLEIWNDATPSHVRFRNFLAGLRAIDNKD